MRALPEDQPFVFLYILLFLCRYQRFAREKTPLFKKKKQQTDTQTNNDNESSIRHYQKANVDVQQPCTCKTGNQIKSKIP